MECHFVPILGLIIEFCHIPTFLFPVPRGHEFLMLLWWLCVSRLKSIVRR
jgi:hypothetical protein